MGAEDISLQDCTMHSYISIAFAFESFQMNLQATMAERTTVASFHFFASKTKISMHAEISTMCAKFRLIPSCLTQIPWAKCWKCVFCVVFLCVWIPTSCSFSSHMEAFCCGSGNSSWWIATDLRFCVLRKVCITVPHQKQSRHHTNICVLQKKENANSWILYGSPFPGGRDRDQQNAHKKFHRVVSVGPASVFSTHIRMAPSVSRLKKTNQKQKREWQKLI